MQNLLTVRLPDIEAQSLDTLCAATGRSRSEIVRDALHCYRLRETMRQSQPLAPVARASGWLTEDDILDDIT